VSWGEWFHLNHTEHFEMEARHLDNRYEREGWGEGNSLPWSLDTKKGKWKSEVFDPFS